MIIFGFGHRMKSLESVLRLREIGSQLTTTHRIISHASPFQATSMKCIDSTRSHQASCLHRPFSAQHVAGSRINNAPRPRTPIELLNRLTNIRSENIRHARNRTQGRSNQCCFWMRKERYFIIIPSRIHFGEVEQVQVHVAAGITSRGYPHVKHVHERESVVMVMAIGLAVITNLIRRTKFLLPSLIQSIKRQANTSENR